MALAAVASTVVSAPARACSYAATPTLEGAFPRNEAVDVPTNGVLFVHGSLGVETGFTLTDEHGVEVPIEVSPAEPRGVVIRPIGELAPETVYELRVGDADADERSTGDRLTFTTAAGSKARGETPPAPTVRLQEFAYSSNSSCGMIHGLCVDAMAPEGYVIQLDVDGDVLLVARAREFPVRRGSNGNFPDDGCIDVRFRGPLGELSPATRLCGTEVERVTLPAQDFQNSYDCNQVEAASLAEPSNASDAGWAPVEAPLRGGSSTVARGTVSATSDLAPSDEPAASSGGCNVTSSLGTTNHGWLAWSVLALLMARSRRTRSASRAEAAAD